MVQVMLGQVCRQLIKADGPVLLVHSAPALLSGRQRPKDPEVGVPNGPEGIEDFAGIPSRIPKRASPRVLIECGEQRTRLGHDFPHPEGGGHLDVGQVSHNLTGSP